MALPTALAVSIGGLIGLLAMSPAQDADTSDAAAPTLEETRLIMGKWIETQQIISKERNEWQQGKDILIGRIDLVKREIASLEEKIQQAQSSVEESDRKRDALLVENERVKEAGVLLADAVTRMEIEVKRLLQSIPQPIQERLEPLHQRIPEDAATTRVSTAERFQNVLDILNELNKVNNEITINYEVHTLADGRPSEVKAIYVGLAQAYYVSARGEGGIGRPTENGWTWEPAPDVSRAVMTALDIVEGKQTPAFVPLPVKLQ
jgi:hypothetical protein